MSTALKADPNEVAMQLTSRDYVSWSAISTYQSCPLRYFFRYIEGLSEESVSSSLVFGGATHAAIEHWFNERMAGGPEPDQDALLSVFWDDWKDRQEESDIKFTKGEDVNSIGELAQRVLTAFQESVSSDNYFSRLTTTRIPVFVEVAAPHFRRGRRQLEVSSVIIVTFSNTEGCGGYRSPSEGIVGVSGSRDDVEGGGVEIRDE